jgi:glycerol-3-phosphate dehydrogenase (NAD(P)+)
MAKVVVLGAGMMGTAVTIPLTDRGHDVILVGTHLDSDIIEEIHESRYHPRLRTHVDESVKPYTYMRLEEALQGADLLVLGVNSLGIDWAAKMLAPILKPEIPVLALTKGLAGDGERIRLLPDVFRAGLPALSRNQVRIAAVGGPSIAGELAAHRHTCIVITGTDQLLLDSIAQMLRTPYYHIWTSTDVVGVEVSVALKNLYSLAVGCVQGLLEKEGTSESQTVMYNLAAAIFAQGLWEMSYLVEFLGGSKASVMSLPGVGDLYVTSQGGRNMRMGCYLGMGMKYHTAKAEYMPEDTIEGAELAFAVGPTIGNMVGQGVLEVGKLPLLLAMINVLCHEVPIEFPWDDFFA